MDGTLVRYCRGLYSQYAHVLPGMTPLLYCNSWAVPGTVVVDKKRDWPIRLQETGAIMKEDDATTQPITAAVCSQ